MGRVRIVITSAIRADELSVYQIETLARHASTGPLLWASEGQDGPSYCFTDGRKVYGALPWGTPALAKKLRWVIDCAQAPEPTAFPSGMEIPYLVADEAGDFAADEATAKARDGWPCLIVSHDRAGIIGAWGVCGDWVPSIWDVILFLRYTCHTGLRMPG